MSLDSAWGQAFAVVAVWHCLYALFYLWWWKVGADLYYRGVGRVLFAVYFKVRGWLFRWVAP